MLRCSGDEDRATQGLRRQALSRARRISDDLRVDLAALTFADSSLMIDLALVAQTLRREGRVMRVQGARPHIARLIELVGLDHQPGVVIEGPSPALA